MNFVTNDMRNLAHVSTFVFLKPYEKVVRFPLKLDKNTLFTLQEYEYIFLFNL